MEANEAVYARGPRVGAVARVNERDRYGATHPLAGVRVVVVARGREESVSANDDCLALVEAPWSKIADVLLVVLRRAGIGTGMSPEAIRDAAGRDGLYFEGFIAEELTEVDEDPVCPRCGQTCHSVRKLARGFVVFQHDSGGHLVEIGSAQ